MRMHAADSDTIAAVATAPGEAGIAIVRISGPQSITIADKVFRHPSNRPSQVNGNRFLYGHIAGRDAARIDEVILLVFRHGHSYTREDVVEIQCHGGRTSARRVLETVLDAGARLAEPGEFTRRAFLNGRLDLVQAEAVIDLIRARSDRAASMAVEQLEGRLSSVCAMCYDKAVSVCADLEAGLDFDEDEVPEILSVDVRRGLEDVAGSIRELLATWREGRVMREGALVVIAGRPNVGKSTLLNCLLGSDRAIVTDVPGTTRDVIEEQCVIDGIPFRLIDTAGLRDSDCRVEQEGIGRARKMIERADIVLYVIDASQGLEDEDRQAVIALAGKGIAVLNKTDLGNKVDGHDLGDVRQVHTSLKTGTGLKETRAAIVDLMGIRGVDPLPHVAISERHRSLLQSAADAIARAQELIKGGNESHLFAAQYVRQVCNMLGSVIGATYSDDILDRVFGRFCLGK